MKFTDIVLLVPMESLSSSSEAAVRKVMKEMKMDWLEAWTYIRCQELEDGASICCSEECEEHDSAVLELVFAAEKGAEKRKARRPDPPPSEPDSEAEEEEPDSEAEEAEEDDDSTP